MGSKSSYGRKITKFVVGEIFTTVWNTCIPPENIVNGFRKTGIMPFNRNCLPEEAFFKLVNASSSTPVNNEMNQSEADDTGSISAD